MCAKHFRSLISQCSLASQRNHERIAKWEMAKSFPRPPSTTLSLSLSGLLCPLSNAIHKEEGSPHQSSRIPPLLPWPIILVLISLSHPSIELPSPFHSNEYSRSNRTINNHTVSWAWVSPFLFAFPLHTTSDSPEGKNHYLNRYPIVPLYRQLPLQTQRTATNSAGNQYPITVPFSVYGTSGRRMLTPRSNEE